MSDEYGANSGFKGSLVNKSGPQVDNGRLNENTGNYPSPENTTLSGGYGSPPTKVWSDKSQRGRGGVDDDNTGLIGQSVHGVFSGEMQDAKQGRDEGTRTEFEREAQRNGHGVGDSAESRQEAEQMLASQYHDSRSRQYESGGVEGDRPL
ncbi:hypothetical protein EUX98_g5451 [Antrodiella citrinella]|uniref:Uncharacterized protein n=1 Tax=Antrodiella citrinella TaxID=2447956 RepID=A0A4S4MSF4_9APHY|nr:hypothetical protein EUX98_g5451 [Antrodiella citrinella]